MSGRLYGLGVGPGDPELLTIKALRILQLVAVIAYPASAQGNSLARSIVAPHLTGKQVEIPITLPFKLNQSAQPYYDQAAENIAAYLNRGEDVAVLCEGDPFFYGSFMYIFNRLSERFATEVVPGISSVTAIASTLGLPLTYRNDVFTVLSGILPASVLTARLADADAAVIIKLGKNFTKVRDCLQQLGLLERAKYIEYATMHNQRILPLHEVVAETVPYFSLILIASQSNY